jgi:hypothetical protein
MAGGREPRAAGAAAPIRKFAAALRVGIPGVETAGFSIRLGRFPTTVSDDPPMCAPVSNVMLIYARVLLSLTDGGNQISHSTQEKADAPAEECHTYVFRFSNVRLLHNYMRRES